MKANARKLAALSLAAALSLGLAACGGGGVPQRQHGQP